MDDPGQEAGAPPQHIPEVAGQAPARPRDEGLARQQQVLSDHLPDVRQPLGEAARRGRAEEGGPARQAGDGHPADAPGPDA
eukprot:8542871-Alexandrium_andersonii.AAC.1